MRFSIALLSVTFVIYNFLSNSWAGSAAIIHEGPNTGRTLGKPEMPLQSPFYDFSPKIREVVRQNISFQAKIERIQAILSEGSQNRSDPSSLIPNLYRNFSFFAMGTTGPVWKAVTHNDQTFAVKAILVDHVFKIATELAAIYELENLVRTGKTDFFTPPHRTWVAPAVPNGMVREWGGWGDDMDSASKWLTMAERSPGFQYQYLEMEYVEGDHPRELDEYTPAERFERCQGVWAGLHYSGIFVSDENGRNRRTVAVDYFRAYHFNGKIYLIPPSERLVKRLDYGNIELAASPQISGEFPNQSFLVMCRDEISAIRTFEVTEANPIPSDVVVKHFQIQ